MYSVHYGVSTMNTFRRILLASAVAGLTLLLAQCGSEDPVEITAGDSLSDSAQLVAVIRETIERLRFGDKSGLYENEFRYFREKETYDDYLRHGEVTWANADSLDSIHIVDVTLFGRDSAHCSVLYFFGGVSTHDPSQPLPTLRAYWHEGRWIKPYMSSISRQLDYEALIRQAEEDSEE